MSGEAGARLKELRIEKGLTQQELAAPRFSHAYVSSIESGRRKLSRAAALHFATKLGIDAEELESGRPHGIEERLRLRLGEARILLSRGEIDVAQNTYRETADTAASFELTVIEAAAVEGLGRCLEQQGRLEEAAQEFERAEDLLRGLPALALVGARCGRARCIAQRGDRRYAAYLLEGLLERMRDTPAPDALAYVHATLIPIYFQLGAFTAAKQSADEARRAAPRVEDPYVLATMHTQVARVLLGQGHPELARDSLVQAEELFRDQELDTERGMAHLAHGYVSAREGRTREARRELKQAFEIFQRAGRPTERARAANELARLQRESGDPDGAVPLLEEARALLSEDSDPSELALTHRELGLCLTENDPAMAEKHLNTAIALFNLAEDMVEVAVTHWYLGLLLRGQGRTADACEMFETGLRFLHERI